MGAWNNLAILAIIALIGSSDCLTNEMVLQKMYSAMTDVKKNCWERAMPRISKPCVDMTDVDIDSFVFFMVGCHIRSFTGDFTCEQMDSHKECIKDNPTYLPMFIEMANMFQVMCHILESKQVAFVTQQFFTHHWETMGEIIEATNRMDGVVGRINTDMKNTTGLLINSHKDILNKMENDRKAIETLKQTIGMSNDNNWLYMIPAAMFLMFVLFRWSVLSVIVSTTMISGLCVMIQTKHMDITTCIVCFVTICFLLFVIGGLNTTSNDRQLILNMYDKQVVHLEEEKRFRTEVIRFFKDKQITV